MSSHADRIKAFKLAQHARLQKQDEEEQWISSEELCTEGSSDEETHTSNLVKVSHRKQKRNPPTEKRGISPLAQTPKSFDCEQSTSTYQRDSKYLLPTMYTSEAKNTNTSTEQPETITLRRDSRLTLVDKLDKFDIDYTEAHSSKSSSKEEEEYDDELEVDEIIQWRPKRGSIKLPDFPEERSSTVEHTIFEVELFYTEMLARISPLKRKRRKTIYSLFDDLETHKIENDKSLHSILRNRNQNPGVCKLLESVFKLDAEILERNEIFLTIKQERKVIQEEMCNAIAADTSPALAKTSQIFLQLCNFENVTETIDKDEKPSMQSSDQLEKKQKTADKYDKNFVIKNIELAKQRAMAHFSLTDEEKVKLESLLTNIDSEEYSLDNSTSTTMEKMKLRNSYLEHSEEDTDDIDDTSTNHFKLKRKELSTIDDLNIRLQEILKSYDENERDLTGALVTIEDESNLFESADNEGRYWKHHQLEKRLEVIEKDLFDMAAKDKEENPLENVIIEENNLNEEEEETSDD